MSSEVSVTIKNESGSSQTYVVFAELPTIEPAPKAIHTYVMISLPDVPSHVGQTYFTLPSNEIHAICGTSNSPADENHVHFEVFDSLPVKLGTYADKGKLQPGTMCEVVLSDGVPRFADEQIKTALGEEGAFCVNVRGGFTDEEAETGCFIVGLGVSTQSIDEIGPQALFVPSPNMLYKVKPSTKVYVAHSRMRSRDIVTPSLKEDKKSCVVFDQVHSSHVRLKHNRYGALVRE